MGISRTGFMLCLASSPLFWTRYQLAFSRELVLYQPELTVTMYLEFTKRFLTATLSGQRLILFCLEPWLERVKLKTEELDGCGENVLDTNSYLILNNLFYLSARFSDAHGNDFGLLWTALSQGGSNSTAILDYLIAEGTACRDPFFLHHAKNVAVQLARGAVDTTVEVLVSRLRNLEPVTPSHQPREGRDASLANYDPFIAPLGELFSNGAPRLEGIHPRHYALFLIVEVVSDRASYDWAAHLPKLLHALFVGVWQDNWELTRHCRELLANLLAVSVVDR
jgi:hypothetical protein